MERFEEWKKAGKILEKTLIYAKSLIKPNALLLEIAEKIEGFIKKQNALPAFPCNLSINEIAAHWSPFPQAKEKARGLIKLDIGVNFNGYLADAALSFNLEKDAEGKLNRALIRTALDALKNGIKAVKPGVEVWEIGKAIEAKIRENGFKPIFNLTGHTLSKYKLHAGKNIPNWNNKERTKLNEAEIIAIEPFVTLGWADGLVIGGKQSSIWIQKKELRPRLYRDLYAKIKSFKGLPFCERWINSKSKTALVYFQQLGIVSNYPQLIEKSKAKVSQAETTLIVKDKPILLVDLLKIFD